jgi:hypothetical protein
MIIIELGENATRVAIIALGVAVFWILTREIVVLILSNRTEKTQHTYREEIKEATSHVS